jgi:hypothetical protein
MNELEKLKAECIDYINAKFSKVKPKIEAGKWYKLNHENVLCLSDGKLSGVGFIKKSWQVSIHCSDHSKWTLATAYEIEETLKAECLKRFNIGDNIQCLDNEMCDLNGTYFVYEYNKVYAGINRYLLFDNGKWATVIKQKIKSYSGNALVFTQPISEELLTKIKNIL